MKKMRSAVLALLIFFTISFLTGCALLVIGGLAGATGYLAAKQGYKIQSPVVKKK